MTYKVMNIGFVLLVTPVMAQNTGGVFGPVVNEGHASLQYRATLDTDNNDFAQRVHFQKALNDDFMWRAVLGTRETEDAEFDFDFFQAELFWDLSDNDDAWRTGLRFDLKLQDEGRPNLVGFHWTNQYKFDDYWSAGFVVLSSIDFGDSARDGVFFQTRASLMRRVDDDLALGLELYSLYGSSDNFLSVSDQTHQLGPVVTFSLSENLSVYTNVLFGLTDQREDPQLRLWLTMKF